MENFDLLNELQNYKPFNEKETQNVNFILNFLKSGKNQFSRENLSQHIVASAYILDESLDYILLDHHKALGFWVAFGGHSDGDSNSLRVALREVNEETQISNLDTLGGKILDVDIHTIPNNAKKNEPEHLHLDIRFLFVTKEKSFKISDESDDIKWFKISDFFEMIKNSTYFSGADRIVSKIKSFIENNKKRT